MSTINVARVVTVGFRHRPRDGSAQRRAGLGHADPRLRRIACGFAWANDSRLPATSAAVLERRMETRGEHRPVVEART